MYLSDDVCALCCADFVYFCECELPIYSLLQNVDRDNDYRGFNKLCNECSPEKKCVHNQAIKYVRTRYP